MSRVLGRVRLSRFTKESTSVERQREVIEAWARANEHEIVGWAVDIDFSRGVAPFEAPEFGPWLSDPDKIRQWDIVAVWKLDRLAVGSVFLNAILSWSQANDKIIMSVTESLDFSTWVGRLVANVIAGVAEGEWEAIKERTSGSQIKIRELRRWHGGTAPFGYRAERIKPAGVRLAVNEPEAALVREIADKVIDGHSVNSITRWLDETEFRPRRGGHWVPRVVTRMLQSRWILGQKTHKGALILDDDGMPAQFAAPIFGQPENPAEPDMRKWQAIQTALDNRKVQKKRSHGTALLLNVARCECGEWLYQFVKEARGNTYRYYRCSGKTKRRNDCTLPSITADELESFVAEQFLDDLGPYERTEKIFVAGSGNADEVDRADRAIGSIRRERDLGLYDDDDEGYFSRLKALTDRRKTLAAEPIREPHWEQQGLGETYYEAWARMDNPERRELLIDHGIRVTARAKPFAAEMFVPVDTVRKRLPEYEPPSAV